LKVFLVNSAATFAGMVEKINPRSFRSPLLMPADTPLAKKPGTLTLFVDFVMTATPFKT